MCKGGGIFFVTALSVTYHPSVLIKIHSHLSDLEIQVKHTDSYLSCAWCLVRGTEGIPDQRNTDIKNLSPSSSVKGFWGRQASKVVFAKEAKYL